MKEVDIRPCGVAKIRNKTENEKRTTKNSMESTVGGSCISFLSVYLSPKVARPRRRSLERAEFSNTVAAVRAAFGNGTEGSGTGKAHTNMKKMNERLILVTNDDGVGSRGMAAAIEVGISVDPLGAQVKIHRHTHPHHTQGAKAQTVHIV